MEILALGQHVDGLGILDAFTHTLCLAADGRVGAGVSGADGQRALACGDASGFAAVVRAGDPSPRGGVFVDFPDCAMPADGGIYFAATRQEAPDGRLTQDVYRATPDGIEWIVGGGAIATDGTLLQRIGTLNGGNVPGAPVFEVNDRGTVLVRAQAGQGSVLARVRGRGAPEALRAVYGNGGLAGDDTVLLLARLPPSNGPAIVALDGDQMRVLFTAADISADLGLIDPINLTLDSIMVRGGFFTLQFEYWTMASPCQSQNPEECPTEGHGGFAWYSPTHGLAPILDPTLYDAIWVVDLTAGGRALIAAYKDRPWPNFSDNVVLDDSGVHLISHDLNPILSSPGVLALNDRGNVLLQTQTAPSSDVRQSLSMTGPLPGSEARCFIPPTAVAPTAVPTETPTAAPTPTPTATPIDCAVQPDACAHLRVGSIAGVPGERVTVEVTLEPGPWSVVGLQGDLRLLGQAPLARTGSGEPACRVDPAIGKPDSRFGFQPAGCSADCTDVRAIVVAFDNLDPIPRGAPVFACDLSISEDAAPGRYPLTLAAVIASDARGRQVPIGGVAGALTVNPVQQDGVSFNTAATAGSGGCQVGQARQRGAWWTLVFPVLALGARAARSRRAMVAVRFR